MTRNDLEKRLRELGIYNDFFQRKELKMLSSVLQEGERLNCILTGVQEANRKMLAVTDRRLLILFASLGGGDVKVIPKEAVQTYRFEKKLLFSSVTVCTQRGETYTFTNTQGGLKKLFEWAMELLLAAEGPEE